MLDAIKTRLDQELLLKAASRYGVVPDQLRLLGDFDSFIFEYDTSSIEKRILRVSHSSKRNPELVMGELDWLNYLDKGGASVCAPIRSLSGHVIEELDDNHGGKFIVASFQMAEGSSPETADWNKATIETYGELLGRIHRLSRDYTPADPRWRRLAWNNPVMLDVEASLPAGNKVIIEIFRDLLDEINTLPIDNSGYGLIHQDAHGGNLKIDSSGQIRLYDFFDCAYSWFINDIAILLFYATMWPKDRTAFASRFMTDFLAGYRREYTLDALWFQHIPLFLKLREIDLYAVILREFGNSWHEDKWNAAFMRGRKDNLEAGIPYIDFDFSQLAEQGRP